MSGASGGRPRAGRGRRSTTSPITDGVAAGAGGLQSAPVCHVSWFEADAFARAHGARLPTEAEWEKAATWEHETPEAIGLVWEWTASAFHGYPGFSAYPYREYSEVFFGEDYRVLRGGSWATHPRVATLTFRNWDLPLRRQIFAGVRLRGTAKPTPNRCRAAPGATRREPMEPRTRESIRIDSHLDGGQERSLAEDVLDGLTRPFKELPPKHFYDARGAELFDQICELPEYYPTRAERAILEQTATELATLTSAVELVELGSGTAAKTRVLLDALHAAGTLQRYVPVDVTESMVRDCAETLTEEYPGLRVHGVIGDFERHLDGVPAAIGPRIVAFLGGTIGNFQPGSRRRFLRSIGRLLGPEDHLLMGTDLVKDPDVLEAAYDDAQGVTAEFNRNVLQRAQPRARRRLRPRGLRPHRPVRHRARVDRDAPARTPRAHDARARAGPARALRRRRGSAHGDQREVHPRAAGGRPLRGGARARALAHRPRRAVRAHAVPRRAIGSAAVQIEGSSAIVVGGASGLGEATVRAPARATARS